MNDSSLLAILLIDSLSDFPGVVLYCCTKFYSFLISWMVLGFTMVFFLAGAGSAKKSICASWYLFLFGSIMTFWVANMACD